MSKIKDIQNKIEGTVENSIDTIEQYYGSLAGKTFDYVDNFELKVKAFTAQDIRVKHNDKIVSVFENVRALNASANDFIKSLLSKLEKDVEEIVEDVKEAVEEIAEEVKDVVENVSEAVKTEETVKAEPEVKVEEPAAVAKEPATKRTARGKKRAAKA